MRLTKKVESQGADVIYHELSLFEDLMEEQGFESLEELKLRIEYYQETIDNQKFNYDELHKYKNKLQQENQALKDMWEKLKEFLYEECDVEEDCIYDENGEVIDIEETYLMPWYKVWRKIRELENRQ